MDKIPFMSNAEIISLLFNLKERIESLEAGKSHYEITEVSLYGACKLMNRGHDAILKLINSGLLPAASETIMKHTKTGKKKLTHYRIRVKDIREYQDKRITTKIKKQIQEPGESIADTFKQIVNEFNKKKPSIKRKTK